MSTQRALTPEEREELEALSTAVSTAISTRQDWLDAKMHETSRLKVGDDIYDIDKGVKVGVVVELYRYHTGRNELYDTDHYCHYRYASSPGYTDNTSRQPGRSFGTKEDAAVRAESKAAQLR